CYISWSAFEIWALVNDPCFQKKCCSLLYHLRIRDVVSSFDVFLKRGMKLHHGLIYRGEFRLNVIGHKRLSHILSTANPHSVSICASGNTYDMSDESGIVLRPTASHRRVAQVGTGENTSIVAMPF